MNHTFFRLIRYWMTIVELWTCSRTSLVVCAGFRDYRAFSIFSVSTVSYHNPTAVPKHRRTNVHLLKRLIADRFHYLYLLGLLIIKVYTELKGSFSLSVPAVQEIIERSPRGIRNKRDVWLKSVRGVGPS